MASSPSATAACSTASSGSQSEAQAFSETSPWTLDQEKAFENALALYDQDTPNRWEKVAAMVVGKDSIAVKDHYDVLVEDVSNIDCGKVLAPLYPTSSLECAGEASVGESPHAKHVLLGQFSGAANGSSKTNCTGKGTFKSSDQERRKGIPWTEDEHRLFLLGLEKFGKGDWRSISRNFVVSRTPTQVASHAQKYFIRLNSMNKDRRRTSIHDITNVNGGDGTQPTSQGPITGQGTVGPPLTYTASSTLVGGTVYGAPVVQPMVGPGGSTIGTPVSLAPSGVPGSYPATGPMTGSGVHGPHLGGVAIVYPVPHQPIFQQPPAEQQ